MCPLTEANEITLLTRFPLFQPPKVKCLTKLWHPNITTEGEICLSLLRENSIDGLGWVPARRKITLLPYLINLYSNPRLSSELNDVIWGLFCLFTDLLNFEDPLNREAAQQYETSKKEFEMKVRDYIQRYAR